MSVSKITVKRPDPETGELIEEAVAADHFKPKLPQRPKVDESRITLIRHGNAIGPTGRSVVYMIGHREAEIAYWEAHTDCLTRQERSDLANGRTSSILRPIKAAWGKGDKVDVANNVEAEITGIEETLHGPRTVFRVLDFRPWLPKRILGGGSRPKVGEHGFARPVDESEQERARIDGAYTRSSSLAIDGTDDELDDKLHARLHAEASMITAMQQSKRRVRVSKLQIEQRLADARMKHRRSTVRYLERQIASIERKEKGRAAA